MTSTLTAPATIAQMTIIMTVNGRRGFQFVVISDESYTTAERAATAAIKASPWSVRGSQFFDGDGVNLRLSGKAEATLLLIGFRWIVKVAGRWYVTELAQAA